MLHRRSARGISCRVASYSSMGLEFDCRLTAEAFKLYRGSAAKAGIQAILVDCIWGEPFGSSFEGKSLPDPPDEEVLERNAQELARWTWLFEDPLAELERLSIRSGGEVHSYPGHAPEWLELLQKIQDYLPSLDTASQLKRAGIEDLWTGAFGEIIASPVVAMASSRARRRRMNLPMPALLFPARSWRAFMSPRSRRADLR